jgi:hypothetical protein
MPAEARDDATLQAHTAPGTSPSAPGREEFGGEVRVGTRPGPRWLRLWYYVVYLWAILYLFGAYLVDRVIDGGGAYYGIVAAFGLLLTGWLGYIIWKKKPPEP